MTILGLIFKEIIHRRINFILGLLAVLIAVGLFISFFTAGQASNRETARLMRDMGFNLRIIPKETDMSKFWMAGFSEHTMPEEYIDTFASQKGISYNHLVATLQAKILWQGVEVILTGLAPERCPPGREKPPMSSEIIKQGTAYIGYELAKRVKLKKGKTIDIRGKTLTVAKTLSESGGVDDIRIQCHLQDAQDILNLKGEINEIKAIDCLCFVLTDDPLAILREELAAVLPEAKTIQMKPMATARAETRQLVRNVFAVIMPIVVVACGAWIGVLAIMNVRDRQQEIGIMRALGYGSGRITLLFLGKAVIIGLLGAAVGFFTGTALALHFGPGIFKITAKAIKPEYVWLVWSLIVAPVFAAVSSFIPTMIAVTYDPAVTLREE
ncbi:MAG: ABC transporter permease [Planctomycetota bacterium]|jgi:ABC-type lipoprotein release transport system permease subunit